MQIVDNFIILALIVLAFTAGVKLANYFNKQAAQEQKYALQKQYARLQTRSDADDACQPYVPPINNVYPKHTGDFDGDPPQPISANFYKSLKQTGRAVTQIKRADIAK